MSDLRALLDEAVPTPPPLDLERIRRRVTRRRRQRRWGAVSALAVLAAATAGLVVVWPRDDAQHVSTAVGVDPEHVGDVAASGDGRLFVTGSDDEGHYVAEIDPASGLVAWRVEVTGGPAHRIAYGLGRIWLLRGGVLSVDPDTHEVTTVTDERGMATAAIGFTDHYAWIADAGQNRLLRVGPGMAATTIELPGQPDQVAVSDDGTVWVRLADVGTVVGLVRDRPTIAVTAPWAGPLLAGSVNSAVWTTDGEQLVEVSFDLLSIGQSVALGRRVPISDVRHVLRREDGLVVVTDDRVVLLSGDDLDLETLDAARGVPVAPGTIGSPAVVDGDVWYVSGAGSLVQLPAQAGEASYEVVPIRTARGTRIMVRGRGDPRRGKDLQLEVAEEPVGLVQVDQDGAFAVKIWVTNTTALGTQEIRLDGFTIGVLEVIPAESGVAYPHPLYTHCGVISTHFDGQMWLADPRPEGSWWNEEDTPGTLTRQADGTLEFRADSGHSARFVEAPAGTDDPIADCE